MRFFQMLKLTSSSLVAPECIQHNSSRTKHTRQTRNKCAFSKKAATIVHVQLNVGNKGNKQAYGQERTSKPLFDGAAGEILWPSSGTTELGTPNNVPLYILSPPNKLGASVVVTGRAFTVPTCSRAAATAQRANPMMLADKELVWCV